MENKRPLIIVILVAFSMSFVTWTIVKYEHRISVNNQTLTANNEKLKILESKIKDLEEAAAKKDNKLQVIEAQQQVILSTQSLNKANQEQIASAKNNSKIIDLKISEVNDLRSELLTLKTKVKNFEEDLEPKNKVLEAIITSIKDQQGNFLTLITWVLGLFIAFTVAEKIKEVFLQDAEIAKLKEEIKDSLKQNLNIINRESWIEFRRKYILLEYYTAVQAAEQLIDEYKAEDEISKKCVYRGAAILQRIRAISMLAKLKIGSKLDRENESSLNFLFYKLKFDIQDDISILKEALEDSKNNLNQNNKIRNNLLSLMPTLMILDIIEYDKYRRQIISLISGFNQTLGQENYPMESV